ncbi:reverse transcriptase domain-containing protein [Tanacetum coccineum]
MTPIQALTAIQTMVDHSQKWHDGSSSRNIESSSNSEGIATIVNKLENLGPPGYYTRMDNRPPVREKRPSLEELMNKHLEETMRRRTEMEEWHEIIAQIVQTSDVSPKILPCQLPPKELNPWSFTLPCTIGSLNFYAMVDLGTSVNVIPKSIFEHQKLARLKKTDMLVEMADMTKRSPIEIVENVLVKINKFLFLSDFVVMNMLNTRNETVILGRPFLATIHAEIDVFNKEISLGIRSDSVTFNMDKKIHNFTTLIREIYMINATSYTPSDASSRVKETNDVHNKNNSCNQEQGRSRKKGHMLDDIWENYRKVQGDNTYLWHDQKSEEEERRKLGINIEEYEPPMVHVETFEVKRYSLDTGKSFICVTKELMDTLPMGRENRSRFKDMTSKEVNSRRRIHGQT